MPRQMMDPFDINEIARRPAFYWRVIGGGVFLVFVVAAVFAVTVLPLLLLRLVFS